MNAQTLRDRLAAVRNFDVVVDDDLKIEEVIIDIVHNKVIIIPEKKAEPIKSDPALSALDALIKERKGGEKE